jgi:hypothetical protein
MANLLLTGVGGGGQVSAFTVLAPATHAQSGPFVTGTLNPSADAQIFVVVGFTGSIGDTALKAADDVFAGFNVVGSAWTLYQSPAGTATSQTSTHVWTARTTSNPGSGTVTVDTGVIPADMTVTVLEVTGANATTPVIGTVTFSAAGGTTVSLDTASTVDVGDAVAIFGTSRNDSDGMTSTMTEVVDSYRGSNPSATQYIAYRTGSTNDTADIDGTNTVHTSAVAFCIKAAAGGGGSAIEMLTGVSGGLVLTGV